MTLICHRGYHAIVYASELIEMELKSLPQKLITLLACAYKQSSKENQGYNLSTYVIDVSPPTHRGSNFIYWGIYYEFFENSL